MSKSAMAKRSSEKSPLAKRSCFYFSAKLNTASTPDFDTNDFNKGSFGEYFTCEDNSCDGKVSPKRY